MHAQAAGVDRVVPRRLPHTSACYWPTDLYQLKPLPEESIVMI
jgi:hypothetical protein